MHMSSFTLTVRTLGSVWLSLKFLKGKRASCSAPNDQKWCYILSTIYCPGLIRQLVVMSVDIDTLSLPCLIPVVSARPEFTSLLFRKKDLADAGDVKGRI